MRVAVISDLHLGVDEIFQHDEDDFVRFLHNIENNHDKIILLGDIFETLLSSNHHMSLMQTLKKYPKLIATIRNEKYDLVYGNHDTVSEMILGARNHVVIKEGTKTYLFMHGHQFDPLQQSAPQFCEHIVLMLGSLITFKMSKLYEFLVKQESVHCFDSNSYKKRAADYAKSIGADFVITGHTHHPEIDLNMRYMNSGHCAFGRKCYLSLDLSRELYGLHDI